MDQKFRDGDPLSGKPMKRFGEGDDVSSLPAPPNVDEVIAAGEEVLKEKEDTTPERYKGMRCPCGKEYKDCQGIGGILGKDAVFELMAAGIISPLDG